MAEAAEALARETGLDVRGVGPRQCKALGMGIFMAVAEESEQEPKLIILGTQRRAATICRPSCSWAKASPSIRAASRIKPGEEMWKMKGDMAGAAAVIAALGVAARLNLPLHVVGLAPCAENLPGGRAQKPGDVFTGMTGKTMEVISTDAEGRMLLADALAYAARFNPAAVVDIATLTGAQAMALGPQRPRSSPTTTSSQHALLAAADASGDRLWRLPLYDEYAGADQEPGGRREEHRRALRRHRDQRQVHRALHRGLSVGARRHGLDGAVGGRQTGQAQGRDGLRRAAVYRVAGGVDEVGAVHGKPGYPSRKLETWFLAGYASGQTSKLCVISVTPRIVAATEQYFSSDSLIARSTFFGSSPFPVAW